MAVSLAQAKLMVNDDVDTQVIDEFAKSSHVLDNIMFDDVVSGAGNGAALTYGYTRLITQPTAAFRAINAEYTAAEVTKQRYTVDLKPLGGSFQIDRVLDAVGRGAETALQLAQKVKASSALFNDAFFNGDTAVLADAFDGVIKAATGSTTEYLPLSNGVALGYLNLTSVTDKAGALAVLEHVDAWLGSLDGPPDAIYGGTKVLAKFKLLAAWADQLDRTTDAFGRPVQSYNGIRLVNPGAKAGSNTEVLALASRDTDGAGAGGTITGLADLVAVRYGLDGVHAVAMAGRPLVYTALPDFTTAGAVKTGEVELGPAAVAVKATKSVGVFRNLKVA